MDRSTAFPLTMRALELGKSFLIFGGRPTSRAFEKSVADTVLFAIVLSPFIRLSGHLEKPEETYFFSNLLYFFS
jgi:hypothetical protein